MKLSKATYMGYLGPEGTFSHCAADIYKKKYGLKLHPYSSFITLVEAVHKKKVDTAIVPVENSIEGSVGVVLDLLANYKTIKIIAELVLPIKHQLLAKEKIPLNKIRRVMSHPQAIGQCRLWLNKHLPHADIVETPSTAIAAKTVSESKEHWVAIGTAKSKIIYKLQCIAEDINDYKNNTTRFLIISTQDLTFDNNIQNYKTTIEFKLLHEPGSLYEVLGEFAKRKINLTRIESRPTKTELGQYRFFIDFVNPYNEKIIQELLSALNKNKKVSTLRVLGSYPSSLYNKNNTT